MLTFNVLTFLPANTAGAEPPPARAALHGAFIRHPVAIAPRAPTNITKELHPSARGADTSCFFVAPPPPTEVSQIAYVAARKAVGRPQEKW